MPDLSGPIEFRISATATMIDSSFPHSWQATILGRRPLIAPTRHFVYPEQVEEIERGALEVLIRPGTEAKERSEFLATFALGFADPVVPTGVWSCPNPDWICAVAGGYAYLVDTSKPIEFQQVEYQPVLHVTPLAAHNLLLFGGHQSLVAYGSNGKRWETGRLSWEGFKILTVAGNHLTGLGWDMMTDHEFEFQVDLRTGQHTNLG